MIDSISALIGRYPTCTLAHEMMANALVYAYQGNWGQCRIALVNARNAIGSPLRHTAVEQINPIIEGIDRLLAVRSVA